jgi:protein-L-isoaspartate(D-aspartate) O-methyltransferase
MLDDHAKMRMIMLPLLVALLFRCGPRLEEASDVTAELPPRIEADAFQQDREWMVREQIAARGVRDPRTLEAMRHVPRHLFVPEVMKPYAYRDSPLPIGHGQTISQPYIVAFMTEALELKPADRVLEIGTGSGYQAAVLSQICPEVYSMEIIEPLGTDAAGRLKQLGYTNIHLRVGDGYRGWPEAAPFDAIIVTAAPDEIPAALLDQLALGGRMVVPVGRGEQTLMRIRRTKKGYTRENLLPVRFVPMLSEESSAQSRQD